MLGFSLKRFADHLIPFCVYRGVIASFAKACGGADRGLPDLATLADAATSSITSVLQKPVQRR